MTYIDSLIEYLEGQVLGVRVLTLLQDLVDAHPCIGVALELIKKLVGSHHLKQRGMNMG